MGGGPRSIEPSQPVSKAKPVAGSAVGEKGDENRLAPPTSGSGGGGDGMAITGLSQRAANDPPEYPEEARRNRWQGTVKLQMLVVADGTVRDVKVLQSSGYKLLDDSAAKKVATYVVSPYRENGVAMDLLVTLPIQFQLRGPPLNVACELSNKPISFPALLKGMYQLGECMARKKNLSGLSAQIDALMHKRVGHLSAIEAIDGLLGKISHMLGGKLESPKAEKAAKLTSTGKKRRKRRGKFTMSGDDSILAFIKSAGTPTTKEVNKHWKGEGRGGSADNALTKLVKTKKLKRINVKGDARQQVLGLVSVRCKA